MKLNELIQHQKMIVADGGMGTMLFDLGLAHGTCPELWNVEFPANIQKVHEGYIGAGAQIILTNTFGGNQARLNTHSLAERGAELNRAAARIAREAADRAAHPVVVAGSMGPLGELLEPYGLISAEAATEMFATQAQALVDGGVDVLWIETLSDLSELAVAVAGCQQVAPDFPVVTTMTFDKGGRTMMGVTPEAAIEKMQELGAVAMGANCGNGPAEIEAVIEKMHIAQPGVTLVAKANAGLPRMREGQTVYDATPEMMADYARRVRDNGARIIGACCGSTPEHIRAIAGALKED